MAYTRNEPLAGDDLDVSQPKLATNTNGADDSFGVDHYKFSDLTVNNGFHNKVTTPLIIGAVHPTTAANVPEFYAMQDYASIGVIQYSRGPSDAVPTPLTSLQSVSGGVAVGAASSTPVFDFTNVIRASVTLHAFTDQGLALASEIAWAGLGKFTSTDYVNGTNTTIKTQIAGNIVSIRVNAAAQVFWVLHFNMVQ